MYFFWSYSSALLFGVAAWSATQESVVGSFVSGGVACFLWALEERAKQ